MDNLKLPRNAAAQIEKEFKWRLFFVIQLRSWGPPRTVNQTSPGGNGPVFQHGRTVGNHTALFRHEPGRRCTSVDQQPSGCWDYPDFRFNVLNAVDCGIEQSAERWQQ